MRYSIGVAALLAALVPAPCAGQEAAASSAPSASYDYGMRQRKDGDYAGAKRTFMELLLKDPAGAGALEGLGLSCIGLGQYREAAVYLEQWNLLSPGSAYILGLLARAREGMRDDRGALRAYRALSALEPGDCSLARKAEGYFESAGAGVFPKADAYRAVSPEGLDTASPQRISYEGGSASARFRAPAGKGLELIGGAGIRREAQRNAGAGFTYFDVQERIYSAGLAGRGAGADWEAEYGRSFLVNIESSGVGVRELNRARLSLKRGAYGLTLTSLPRYERRSGGAGSFVLLRENAARAEASGASDGVEWLARGGLSFVSDGSTLPSLYLTGTGTGGPYTYRAHYAHGQQQFYSASPSGHLRYAGTDAFGAGLRRGEKDVYSAGLYASGAFYSDSNRLWKLDADAEAWLPGRPDLYARYRFSLLDFGRVTPGYDSIDETGHWLGAFWSRCAGRAWRAEAGYEHGFLRDSLISYNADVYTAAAEWRSGVSFVELRGGRKATDGRGHSWNAGLRAGIAFR
ncbi:MAG: hypothetical protein M0025_13075 [Elusimicrobia bacterium]|nr:hypothetical protein [Elusimicrobiota bacterium]